MSDKMGQVGLAVIATGFGCLTGKSQMFVGRNVQEYCRVDDNVHYTL